MLFDTHAHYDDKRFNDDRDEVIENAFANGVSYILNASSSLRSLDETLKIVEKYPQIYGSVGIHPHNAQEMTAELLAKIEGLAKHPKIVAIGEIGLDYHYDFSPRTVQIEWFEKQIELALRIKYPVIIHNRESSEDMLRIITTSNIREVGGIFHCFSGSIEMAEILLNNNFYLSFGGPVTFDNAKKALDVVKYVPIEKILIETDCPYLTPTPFRGKRNDSSYVKYVAQKIAQIKGLEYEEIAAQTTKNALVVFKIGK